MDFQNTHRPVSARPTEDGGDHFLLVPTAGSDKLVVYFSRAGAAPGSFHFRKDGMEIGTSRLYVNNGRNEWYQNGVPGLGSDLPTTIMNIKLWARHLGASEIYTVGQGMGGHGAILFGTLLGARVLALGAETTIRLPASQSAKLLAPDARTPFLNIHRFIAQASQPIYSLAGENDPTALYCMALAGGLHNHVCRSMNFVDHSPAGYLKEKGRFTSLLRTFLNNEPLPAMEEDGFGCAIEGYAEAYHALFVAYSDRDWAKAAELGAKAIALNPSSDFAQFMTGNAYLRWGRAEAAAGHLAAAHGLNAGEADYLCTLAVCMREVGRIDLSIALHRRLLRTRPDFAKSHHALSLMFMANGAPRQAARHARKAAALEPDNANYTRQAARASKRQSEDIDKLPAEMRRIALLYEKG